MSNQKCEGEVSYWIDLRKKILQYAQDSGLSNFFHWPELIGAMIHDSPKVGIELERLQKSPHWDFLKKGLIESDVGNPRKLWLEGKSSGNLIHQCYHLMLFLDKTGIDFESIDEVIDFGGGYGCMCSLFYRLGFQGKYIIYDLPELSVLQEYYLSNQKETPNVLRNQISEDKKIILLLNNLEELSKVNSAGKRLLIATWSLSEVTIEFRKNFLDTLGLFDGFLIAYKQWQFEINNEVYFQEFLEHRKQPYYYFINDLFGEDQIYLVGSNG